MLRNNFKLLCATALSLAFIGSVEIAPSSLGISSNQAYARSSGGRSGGGSFSRPSSSSSSSRSSQPSSRSAPSSSSSSSSSSQPSSRPSSTSPNRPTRTTPYNPSYSNQPRRQTVVVPVPVAPQQPYYQTSPNNPPPNQTQSNPNSNSNSQSQSQSSSNTSDSDDPMYFWIGLIFLLVMLGVIVGVPSLIIFLLLKNRKNAKSPTNELENDIVTVSKLQVALLANVKGLQSELSELSLRANTETPEGLLSLLQESALTLLRNSDYWSHVLASSQSVNIQQAEPIFTQLSLKERSKFSSETLTHVGSNLKQKEVVIPGLAEDPGAYVVVTLLAGTADDRPLFDEIQTPEALREALERVAAIRSDYLMTFELLWSPQVEADSLTYDELLTEYTDMFQIA